MANKIIMWYPEEQNQKNLTISLLLTSKLDGDKNSHLIFRWKENIKEPFRVWISEIKKIPANPWQ